ncbi:hypothetical protein HPB49_013623 [Dermacentor silvarum]|uniref:Uncharacterized protein n=1 Tax=Dermacentor silvarum TaxID=543639 RepID=A0ACB8DD99_DERSI|nr:hypothetical protein HPB49_013623 [Dermacentor silvarum]
MCGRPPHYHYRTKEMCDADMAILAVDPVRSGSDHDSFVWRTTWLRRRFQAGRSANPAEYRLVDSGYLLEPWIQPPVAGHPPTQTAEGKHNTAHTAMRSVVDGTAPSSTSQNVQPTLSRHVLCCTTFGCSTT